MLKEPEHPRAWGRGINLSSCSSLNPGAGADLGEASPCPKGLRNVSSRGGSENKRWARGRPSTSSRGMHARLEGEAAPAGSTVALPLTATPMPSFPQIHTGGYQEAASCETHGSFLSSHISPRKPGRAWGLEPSEEGAWWGTSAELQRD